MVPCSRDASWPWRAESVQRGCSMYAGTYPSLEAFYEDKRWYNYQAYYFIATTAEEAGPIEATAAVEAVPPTLQDVFIKYLAHRHRGRMEAAESILPQVPQFGRALSELVGTDVHTLIVVADQLAIDGPGGRRFWRRRGLPLVEVELATGRIVTERPEDLEPMVAKALGADSLPMLFVVSTPELRPAGRLYQAPIAISAGGERRPVPDELANRIRSLLRRAPDTEAIGAPQETGSTLHVGPETYQLRPGALVWSDEDGLVLTWTDPVLEQLRSAVGEP